MSSIEYIELVGRAEVRNLFISVIIVHQRYIHSCILLMEGERFFSFKHSVSGVWRLGKRWHSYVHTELKSFSNIMQIHWVSSG